MFDEGQYNNFKKNITDTVVNGDLVMVSTMSFDPNTGERLPDKLETVVIPDIQSRIAGYQDYINNAQAFLNDSQSNSLPTKETIAAGSQKFVS